MNNTILVNPPGKLTSSLAANPSVIIACNDDDRVQEFVRQYNISGFETEDSERNALRANTCTTHPTHWILVIRFSNYEISTENGWTVHCFPKDGMDQTLFHVKCLRICNFIHGRPVKPEDVRFIDRGTNN